MAAETGSDTTEPLELVENFFISNKRKSTVKVQVKLNSEGVYLRRETLQEHHINEQLIRIEDIIGSRCGPRIKKQSGAGAGIGACKRAAANTDEPPSDYSGSLMTRDEKDTSAYLYIYAYVKHERPLRRNRTVRILRFRTHESYGDNLRIAQRWHAAIAAFKGHQHRLEEIPVELAAAQAQGRKPLLILLNPKSGSGKAREMFLHQVVPVLKEAELPYDLQITTHPNCAREMIRSRLDLQQRYAGVVVASGDGLFYEVLNGLLERPDWRTLSRCLPFGIIPCGSGNGLAKSIAHAHSEPYEPKPILNATLTCIAGHTAPLDIVRIEVARGDKHTVMYSFLSVGWGLIADIDIESERLRSIGAPRFTLWSIRRLISLRTYKGKLYYLPSEQVCPKQQPQQNPMGNNSPRSLDHEDVKFHDVQDDDTDDAVGDSDDDDHINAVLNEEEFADIVSLDCGSQYSSRLDSWHSAASQMTAYHSMGGQSMRSRRSTNASILAKIDAANAALEPGGITSTIPPLGLPLPADEWRVETGDFVMVHAAYTTHLASDCFFAPESRLNDGIIYLVVIRAGVRRQQLAQFLLGMATGTHLPTEPNEHISIMPVRAFRIEPSGADGIIAVDGERVDYGPIQGEILPGIINVMVPNRKSIEEGPQTTAM